MFSKYVRGTCVALSFVAISMTGCDSNSPPSKTTTAKPAEPASQPAELPADLFVQQSPEGALEVSGLRADLSRDKSVAVHGRIGGRKEPFVAGRAVFLLADASMKSCDQLEADTCKTPWDYCCEPKENLSKMLATVQVIGPDHKPLQIPLDGKNGLKPLAEVTIVADVVTRTGGALVLTAKKIYVHPARG